MKEIKYIKNEITVLQNLNHQNIVHYYTSNISSNKKGIDIVLEYVPGGSMRQLLDKFLRFDEKLVKVYTR